MSDKKFVIWGTGIRSSHFSKGLEELPVFYIDNDSSKKGTLYFGKEVLHPSEINDWKKYFIIVASSYYTEIKKQLSELGLREDKDFVYYEKVQDNRKRLEKLACELEESMFRFKENFQQYKNSTLIFGSMISFDKNSYRLYNEAFHITGEKNQFLMISETYAIEKKAKKGMIEFPYFCLPLMLWQNFHLVGNEIGHITVTDTVRSYIQKRDYRINALIDFKGKNRDIAEGYAEYFIYYADLYLREMFDYICPRKVLIWNQFYPFHILIRSICAEKRIELLYMEYGVLPGTYLVERTGQMGESYPAVYIEEFQRLNITDSDFQKAKDVYAYLYESGINRKEQPVSDELEKAKKKIRSGRPIVAYAGQNDYESGLYPYTEHTRKYHSPIFLGSNEAARFLAEIAKKNDWNFIYKPHPQCIGSQKEDIGLGDEAIVIEQCNINELVEWADVNVTILSTVAYVSLIRKKPTVMLGYTQLKGKGCTYEAFLKELVEEEISKAIRFGYTDNQEGAFIKHIARLLKYYLYDDMGERDMRFGKDWKQICSGEKIIF